MEACVLSSWRDCLIAVKWQGERERRAGEKGYGMRWDRRKEGIEEERVICS